LSFCRGELSTSSFGFACPLQNKLTTLILRLDPQQLTVFFAWLTYSAIGPADTPRSFRVIQRSTMVPIAAIRPAALKGSRRAQAIQTCYWIVCRRA